MFLYFDMGNVLLHFSHHRAAAQMAAAAGIDPQQVWDLVFAGDLNRQADAGELNAAAYYRQFCRATNSRPDYDALVRGCCDIFEVNLALLPVVAQLAAAGYPLGVLSNTCDMHWEWVHRRYAVMQASFAVSIASYQHKALKPSPAIYEIATAAAQRRPEEIYFVDDVASHVEGAQAFGWNAVLYTSAAQLVLDLGRWGFSFNY